MTFFWDEAKEMTETDFEEIEKRVFNQLSWIEMECIDGVWQRKDIGSNRPGTEQHGSSDVDSYVTPEDCRSYFDSPTAETHFIVSLAEKVRADTESLVASLCDRENDRRGSPTGRLRQRAPGMARKGKGDGMGDG